MLRKRRREREKLDSRYILLSDRSSYEGEQDRQNVQSFFGWKKSSSGARVKSTEEEKTSFTCRRKKYRNRIIIKSAAAYYKRKKGYEKTYGLCFKRKKRRKYIP